MKQGLIDQALASLDAIIADELSDSSPQKYTRIIAIAAQAHRLRRNARRRDRVQDVNAGPYHHGYVPDADLHAAMQGALLPEEENDHNQNDGPALPRPLAVLGAGGPMVDVFRETLSMIRPSDTEFDRTVKRLRALSDVRTALHDAAGDTHVLDAQIRALTATLTADLKEPSDAAAPHPALVHSDFLRGHQTRGAGEQPVPSDRGADDGARARGAQDAGDAGIEATVVADDDGSGPPLQ